MKLPDTMLPASYYRSEDVVGLARDLLGKKLVTLRNGVRTAGIITETEAYSYMERGCHAYGGKMTPRNKVMFEAGGVAYVYLCYGLHHLFNIVSNREGIAEAVLVRGIIPLEEEPEMLSRRRKGAFHPRVFSGPGNVSKAMALSVLDSGQPLTGPAIWLEDAGITLPQEWISATARVGIDYAGEDALLPWRFLVKDVWPLREKILARNL